jgi:signal peptidase I
MDRSACYNQSKTMTNDPTDQSPDDPNPESDAEPDRPPAWPDSAAASSQGFVWSTETSLPPGLPSWSTAEASVRVEKVQPLRIHLARLARDLIETAILALIIFLPVRAMVQNFRVDGSSMENTLHNGQYILVNKAVYFKVDLSFLNFLPFVDFSDEQYIFRQPRRGDVVVFRYPGGPSRDFIKRIVGEPGDLVEIRDGLVFINGKALEESYTADRPQYTYGPQRVPPDQYFVLGDNRNNSFDSHSWGMVPEENIIGRAWLSYWPFSSFGFVSDPTVEPMGAQGAAP